MLIKKAQAVEVHEKMLSPHLEARAQELGRTIKCPTCHGQSIEDSNAEMASLLRRVVRDHLGAGDSPEEVKTFLKETYGEVILFDPSWSPETFLLWSVPFAILFFLVLKLIKRNLI